MNRKEAIEKKISVLKPHYLEIINESFLHKHHLESPNNGESHYTIKIGANNLDNKTRLQQHKIIHNLLKEEFASGLHALSIKIINNK
jgi:BolA family transcriptional regulator, general stress-responsive regulator